MKTCMVCQQTYHDDNLNFCLNDGGILTEVRDDAPPTILMNQVRTTQPNWAEHEPSSPWGSQPMQTQSPNPPFHPVAGMPPGQNQVLPTVSLVLGVLGLLLFCCWGGIPLGVAAAITGYLGYQNANTDPQQYGGRGLAIAGMILGAISLLFGVLILIVSFAGSIFR